MIVQGGGMKQVDSTMATVAVKAKSKISIMEKLSFVWTILSVLFSTAFMIFAIAKQWGNSKYLFVLLGIICAYIVVFVVIISIRNALAKRKGELQKHEQESIESKNLTETTTTVKVDTEPKIEKSARKKGLKRTKVLLKDYKSGLGLLKALMNLLYIVMTITVMVGAASMRGENNIVAWISISISLVLALLTLSFKIATLVLKKMLPRIARKGVYTLYEVVNGKVQEKKRTNKIVAKLTQKYTKKE